MALRTCLLRKVRIFRSFKTDPRDTNPPRVCLLRAAAEHCRATGTEFFALLGDLKWCFDTPASTVIELGLMGLGVPAFYAAQ